MIKTVYIDVLFLINFIINYLLLYASVHLSGAVIKRFLIALGALIGAVYGVLVFFESLTPLNSVILKILIAVIMVFVSFGRQPYVKLIRFTLIFFGLSFGFAGTILAIYYFTSHADLLETNNLVLYINIPFWTLLTSSVFAYFLFSIIFKTSARITSREIHGVEVFNRNKKISFRALVDTGNSLRDPFTNAQVIITEYHTVRDIVPDRARSILDKSKPDSLPLIFEKIPYEYKFKLIPYKTMNSGFNLILAFKPEKIIVNGFESKNALIALSPTHISDGGVYNALI